MNSLSRWMLVIVSLIMVGVWVEWNSADEPLLSSLRNLLPSEKNRTPDAEVAQSDSPGSANDAGQNANDTRVVGFGHVDVDGGTTPLSPSITGRVVEVAVREGERVLAGAALVRLDDEAAQAQVRLAQTAVAEAKIRLTQAKRSPEDHQLRLRQQREAVAVAEARVSAQEARLERLDRLTESSSISQESSLSAHRVLDELKAAVRIEELKLEHLDLDDSAETIALAEAGLDAATARLTMATNHLERFTLRAPTDGLVLRALVTVGESLGAERTRPAIWFCPSGPRIVRCEIDQEFAPRVAVGLKAVAFDDARSERRWTGKVERCADWIAPRRSMLDEPFERNDVRTLECIIVLDSGRAPLRIGQRLRIVIED